MKDLTFTRSGELYVTGIDANSEAGVEFVDSILRGSLVVVDSGRVIVKTDDVPGIERDATDAGLTVEHELVERERPS